MMMLWMLSSVKPTSSLESEILIQKRGSIDLLFYCVQQEIQCYSEYMRIKKKISRLILPMLLLTAVSGELGCQPAIATRADTSGANDASGSREYQSLMKDLKSLEDRYFFHSYDHDPTEKRVERLELLIFGGNQYGVVEDRVKGLKDAIKKRDADSAREHATAKAGAESSQYPVLNTLEWRVLKKTYQKEDLDSRLNRLETKLFGQASPAMSYADRIERLKKIVGINVTSLPRADARIIEGPMPRAGTELPQYKSRALIPDRKTFEDDFRRQFLKDMPNMFKYMEEGPLKRFFEGGGGMSPYMIPSPVPTPKQSKPKIPPYADPNSI